MIKNINLIFNDIACNNNILLDPINESEVNEVMVNLRKGAAPGRDGVTLKDLLNLKDYIIEILTVLINVVFSTGVFPEELKIFKV